MTFKESIAGVLCATFMFVTAVPGVRFLNAQQALTAVPAKQARAEHDLVPAVADAAVVAIISGPTTAPVGELAVLDSADSKNAAAVSWVAFPSTAKNWLVIDGGKRCVATQPKPGDLTLILAASGSAGGISLASRTLTFVGSIPPSPTPTPTPPTPTPTPVPPAPTPPAPNGFDFRSGARDWLKQVTGDPILVKQEAGAIAVVFTNAAAAAESGTLATIDDLIKSTGTGIGSVLQDNSRRTAWAPFGTAMSTALKAEFDAGRLVNTAGHAAAWRQIAAGLSDGSAASTGTNKKNLAVRL